MFHRIISFVLMTALVSTSASAKDINVGPLQNHKTMASAVSAAQAGDRILIEPGIYVNDTATVSTSITIEGKAAGVILRATSPLANRKGILLVNADLRVKNITFEGAHVSVADGNNGAGIRHQSGDLTVEDSTFSHNQNGILANAVPGATIIIENTTFIGNGAGDGYSHAVYINAAAQLIVTGSTFDGTRAGHDVKSRALRTTISDSVFNDGTTGTTSYAVDLPNGGVAVLDDVRITQGARTQNSTMVAYGAEGNLAPMSSLTVSNSTFVNLANNAIGINNFTANVTASVSKTSFQNVGTPIRGLGQTVAPRSLRQGAVVSGARAGVQSFLRFYNSGVAPGTVTVTLAGYGDGKELTTWKSPSIAAGAALQVPISTIEGAATQVFAKPDYYSVSIETQMAGTFQHVLLRTTDGTFTNLSTCDTGITAVATRLTGVHSSLVGSAGFPSSIVIYNTGAQAAAAMLGLYDAATGRRLGAYTSPTISANGQIIAAMPDIEAGANVGAGGGIYHYVVKIEGVFVGHLQHLLENQKAGVLADMTAVCSLPNA